MHVDARFHAGPPCSRRSLPPLSLLSLPALCQADLAALFRSAGFECVGGVPEVRARSVENRLQGVVMERLFVQAEFVLDHHHQRHESQGADGTAGEGGLAQRLARLRCAEDGSASVLDPSGLRAPPSKPPSGAPRTERACTLHGRTLPFTVHGAGDWDLGAPRAALLEGVERDGADRCSGAVVLELDAGCVAPICFAALRWCR